MLFPSYTPYNYFPSNMKQQQQAHGQFPGQLRYAALVQNLFCKSVK